MTANINNDDEDSLTIENSLAILQESISQVEPEEGLRKSSTIHIPQKQVSNIQSVEKCSDDYLPFSLPHLITCRVFLIKNLPSYDSIPNRDKYLLPPIQNQKRLTLVALRHAFHI